MSLRFLLASESPIKLEALRGALKKLGIEAEISTCEADSRVNEQPIGNTEMFRGVSNRVEGARRVDRDAVIIGIENGIVSFGNKRIDSALVLLLLPTSQERFVATSGGIELPGPAVNYTGMAGFNRTTVTKTMNRMDGTPGRDVHSAISGTSRVESLKRAIIDILHISGICTPTQD